MVKQILFLQRIASNFDFFLTVKRPEFLRGHSAPVFEGTVEIGEIVKTRGNDSMTEEENDILCKAVVCELMHIDGLIDE